MKRLIKPSIDYKPQQYLTISRLYHLGSKDLSFFSLGENTDISKESYDCQYLFLFLEGDGKILSDKEMEVSCGDLYFSEKKKEIGLKGNNLTYLQIKWEEEKMTELIKAGEIFKLKDLIEYQEEAIVNLDIASNDQTKFVLMAFDAGTSLDPHRAPGDALVFALEGSAEIGYEEDNFVISEGDVFRFDKNGLHSVKALTNFKMALLLTLA